MKQKSETLCNEPIYVHFELGGTINAGNYESLKVTFGLTVPTSPKEKDATIKQVKKEVIAQMEQEIKRLRGLANGG